MKTQRDVALENLMSIASNNFQMTFTVSKKSRYPCSNGVKIVLLSLGGGGGGVDS